VLEWQARYASVTFSQLGRELAMGGMNERGLVAEIMWHGRASFPTSADDPRPGVMQIQWIQYILDTSANIAEAIAMARQARVVPLFNIKVHYLVCDATGACAAFEYINKKLVVSEGPSVKALTNNTYPEAAHALSLYQGFGGPRAAPERSTDSFERFLIANVHARTTQGRPVTTARGFEILDYVVTEGFTKWQIVYEPQKLRVNFRTLESSAVKTLDLAKIASHCSSSPTKLFDLNTPSISGEITRHFRPYTNTEARRLLEPSRMIKEHPGLLEPLLDYPAENTVCVKNNESQGAIFSQTKRSFL
jgi:hypothetical protein